MRNIFDFWAFCAIKMVHVYENNELVDIILSYGECQQNAAAACRLYAERFPLRNQPAPRTVVNLLIRLRDTGYLKEQRGGHAGRPPPREMVEIEENILEIVENDPTTSTRSVAAQVGTAHSKVWKTIRQEQLYPYHYQRVQALLPEDGPRRVEFCQWLLNQHNRNENFTKFILATDEATFTRNGVTNFHNNHVWAVENPHAVKRTHFQHRFSLNVWAGVLNGMLIGPYFFPARLTGDIYLDFLRNTLPQLLEDIPLNVRQNMWFLQDGAPPHFRREVIEHLNNEFPNRWIGRNGYISWPARSPDLTPCDFFLWGYLKQLVYHDGDVNTVQELQQRIENACDVLRGHPDFIFDACSDSWIRRARLCANRTNGDNFEQFL